MGYGRGSYSSRFSGGLINIGVGEGVEFRLLVIVGLVEGVLDWLGQIWVGYGGLSVMFSVRFFVVGDWIF